MRQSTVLSPPRKEALKLPVPTAMDWYAIILRYVNEIRDAQPYFESLPVADEGEAVSLAVNLIKSMSGPFQPKTMPDKYAEAVEELVKAKSNSGRQRLKWCG